MNYFCNLQKNLGEKSVRIQEIKFSKRTETSFPKFFSSKKGLFVLRSKGLRSQRATVANPRRDFKNPLI